MSQENIEALKRGADALDRGDIEAMLEECDPEVEWHPALLTQLTGAAAVYRGYEGVRDMVRDTFDVFTEVHTEYTEIRDLGDRTLAIGRARTRGRESGAEAESPIASVVDFRNGKALRVWTYLDPEEAIEAAGLSE